MFFRTLSTHFITFVALSLVAEAYITHGRCTFSRIHFPRRTQNIDLTECEEWITKEGSFRACCLPGPSNPTCHIVRSVEDKRPYTLPFVRQYGNPYDSSEVTCFATPPKKLCYWMDEDNVHYEIAPGDCQMMTSRKLGISYKMCCAENDDATIACQVRLPGKNMARLPALDMVPNRLDYLDSDHLYRWGVYCYQKPEFQ